MTLSFVIIVMLTSIRLVFEVTKNGTGRYVLMDIGDYGRIEGVLRLSYELQRGKKSGETQGWISHRNMKKHCSDRVHG